MSPHASMRAFPLLLSQARVIRAGPSPVSLPPASPCLSAPQPWINCRRSCGLKVQPQGQVHPQLPRNGSERDQGPRAGCPHCSRSDALSVALWILLTLSHMPGCVPNPDKRETLSEREARPCGLRGAPRIFLRPEFRAAELKPWGSPVTLERLQSLLSSLPTGPAQGHLQSSQGHGEDELNGAELREQRIPAAAGKSRGARPGLNTHPQQRTHCSTDPSHRRGCLFPSRSPPTPGLWWAAQDS